MNQNIEHNSVLIDGSPEVVSDTVDLQEDLVKMLFITGSRTPSPEAGGILLTDLIAPAPDGFVTDLDSAGRHHLLYISKAHAETEVVPNALGNDFSWKPMATVEVVRHSSSIASERNGLM